MANKRNHKASSGRDAGGFVALPWSVLDSPAYAELSANAKALLLEVARQYCRDNNGRLLLSRAHLGARGWTSVDMITKGKRELLDAGFIHETVKGQRPNKASWYAVTWHSLDKIRGFDQGAELLFQRSAYLKKAPVKNAPLIPSHGAKRSAIGPPHGTDIASPVPSHGAMVGVFSVSPVPPHGHHLDKPSPVVVQPASNSMTADTTPQAERPTATTNDDGISQGAIDALDKLWEAVGVRVNKGLPMLERIQMAKAVPQQVTGRHSTEPASTAHAGSTHNDEDTVREHDEHASDLSHRND